MTLPPDPAMVEKTRKKWSTSWKQKKHQAAKAQMWIAILETSEEKRSLQKDRQETKDMFM